MAVYGSSTDPNDITASRDACTDAGASGDASQYDGRYAYQGTDFSPMSLQEEADAEGWTRLTRPVPGRPADATTVGTRGASDEAVGDKDSPSSGYEPPGGD